MKQYSWSCVIVCTCIRKVWRYQRGIEKMCDCMYKYKKSLKIPKGYWEVAIQTNTKTQWSNEHNTSNGRQNTTQRVRIKKKEKQERWNQVFRKGEQFLLS